MCLQFQKSTLKTNELIVLYQIYQIVQIMKQTTVKIHVISTNLHKIRKCFFVIGN